MADGYPVGSNVWINIWSRRFEGDELQKHSVIPAVIESVPERLGTGSLDPESGDFSSGVRHSTYGQRVTLLQGIPGTAITAGSEMYPGLHDIRPMHMEEEQ